MPYAIPATNPLLNGARSEIWSVGLRNPWRFSFDRQAGDLYVADVGQSALEELDFQPAAGSGGQNYGWRLMEGSRCYNPPTNCDSDPQVVLTAPVLEYDHSQGNCSITGGFVYRGARFVSMQGVYFFADYCSGRIWGARTVNGAWQSQLLIDSTLLITSFGEDEEGELYVADHSAGILYNLVVADRIGAFRQGSWYFDGSNVGVWEGCALDSCLGPFGAPADLPVMGDWTGTGSTQIGVFRRGAWYLDRNGNGAWDGCGTTAGTDICYPAFGTAGDRPVAGDWSGSGSSKIGVYRNSAWYLDFNGNGSWDGCAVDLCIPSFGQPSSDLPVVMKPGR